MLSCLSLFLVIAKRLIFWMGCFVLLCMGIRDVETALFNECKVDADCDGLKKNCCGHPYFVTEQRRCTNDSCIHHYCRTNSDCGNSSLLCCRLNKCEKHGCFCEDDSDCFTGSFCCIESLFSNHSVCAASCVGQPCRSNDDCAKSECCQAGRCVSSGCYENCTSNADCYLGQYCCHRNESRRKLSSKCSKSCVGEICSSDGDCGSAKSCCISSKCSDRGCPQCSTNSDCDDGNVCCRKRYPNEASECRADCLGKSCNGNSDCGGAGEKCNSENKCSKSGKDSSFETWRIILLLPALIIFILACCHLSRKRQRANARRARVHRGTVPM